MNAAACLATPAAVVNAPSNLEPFNVLLVNRDKVETFLKKIVTRLAKKGLTGLSWSWGKAFEVRIACTCAACAHSVIPSHTARVEIRAPLTLETKRPHYAGWNFVATLLHLKNDAGSYENIVNAVPGCMVHDDCKEAGRGMQLACAGVSDLPASFRDRGPVCDHCQVKRFRNDTYVLHHHDGRYMQVGSTCIADFLGSDEAEHMAFRAEMYALAASVAKSAESAPATTADVSFEATSSWGYLLSTYLGYVAWSMRTQGWVSRRMVQNGYNGLTTSEIANLLMAEGSPYRQESGYTVVDEDVQLAVAAAEWAENMTDEQVSAGPDQYLANLRTIARLGLVNWRMMGQAASIIIAYQKANDLLPKKLAPAPKCQTWIGEVGVRLAFGTTKKLGKKIQKLSNEPVTLVFQKTIERDEDESFSILKFQTAEGILLTWMTSGVRLVGEEGKRFQLIGTVKKHDEYKGERQTMLSRCDLTEVL